jgi:DNA (cytosine-5)-methyltransferase 1
MLRVISEIKPTYVEGENVRGLTTWNGGVVFEEVCTDLESQGYTVQPILLPACSVGAPHRRDRVWFVAYNATYSNSRRLERSEEVGRNSINAEWESEFGTATNTNLLRQYERECNNEEQSSQRGVNAFNDINENVESGNATNTCEIGFSSSKPIGKLGRQQRFTFNYEQRIWQKFPSQSPICGGDDGLPTELDGITFSKWRQESIKGYGNAIVPQVAYEIFKVIAEMDRLEKLQLKLF